MNNKLLVTTLFMSIAMGACSASIYTVLDLNSSLLIQNNYSKDSLESDGEKLLALNIPKSKSKKSKEEVEDDEDEDEDEETSDDEEVDNNSENEGDDSDDDDDDDNLDTNGESDDDGDYTEDSGENAEPSNSNGFGDIKSKLEDKNSTLPESKSDFHIHKNAPHNTVVNKLDPQGNLQEYITYLYGDEIIMKFTFSLLANGRYHIDGKVNSNYKTTTPPTMVGNTKDFGSYRLTEFDVYGGKIKATFKITPLRNGGVNIDYNWKIIDPNI